VVGTFEGGTLGLLWAAAEPDRVSSVVVIDSFAKLDWDRSMFGALAGDTAGPAVVARPVWETLETGGANWFAPDFALTVAQQKQMSRGVRLSANPSTIETWLSLVAQLDVRPLLAEIHVPVLVIHRSGDAIVDVSHGRFLAEHLPNATYVEIPGRDHVPWGTDVEHILSEIELFLTGKPASETIVDVTRTIMFTDIVGSTPQLAALGDRAWMALLQQHDDLSTDVLERFGGRCIKSTGDGLLAELPNPNSAVPCALALVSQLRKIGIEVRVGMHAGPCESYGDDLIGLTVNVAARIMSQAGPGEIFVSQAVRDQASGPGFRFSARGPRSLKGIPGLWALFGVVQ
jgi:class 3 adenylate cyclase